MFCVHIADHLLSLNLLVTSVRNGLSLQVSIDHKAEFAQATWQISFIARHQRAAGRGKLYEATKDAETLDSWVEWMDADSIR